MTLPRWVPFLLAVWALAFGVFRLYLARKLSSDAANPDENRPSFRRSGMYSRSPRLHVVFGLLYVLLGLGCAAMGFGYEINVLSSCSGSESSDESPAPESGIDVEVEK